MPARLDCEQLAARWKHSMMEVEVPPNTTATVHVPATSAAAATESGKAVAGARGVCYLRMESGAAVYEVGSGRYVFESSR